MKPEGYTSVAPYLIVADAGAAIDFVTRVFDGVELRRFEGESGRIMHAEARIDDTVVMFSDGQGGWPPVPAHVHVYVPDVDSTYRRALEAGATSVMEPEQKDDEDKRGGVLGPGGITWWVATRIG